MRDDEIEAEAERMAVAAGEAAALIWSACSDDPARIMAAASALAMVGIRSGASLHHLTGALERCWPGFVASGQRRGLVAGDVPTQGDT